MSKDELMGDDNVVVCKQLQSGNVVIEHYYNTGRSKPRLLVNYTQSIELNDLKSSYLNGRLECLLKRDKSLDISNYFDLKQNSSYYILVASGPVDANSKIYL